MVARIPGHTVSRRSTCVTCASFSAVGLARSAYRRGISLANSLYTVVRLMPNSLASWLTVQPCRCRTFISIQIPPDFKQGSSCGLGLQRRKPDGGPRADHDHPALVLPE